MNANKTLKSASKTDNGGTSKQREVGSNAKIKEARSFMGDRKDNKAIVRRDASDDSSAKKFTPRKLPFSKHIPASTVEITELPKSDDDTTKPKTIIYTRNAYGAKASRDADVKPRYTKDASAHKRNVAAIEARKRQNDTSSEEEVKFQGCKDVKNGDAKEARRINLIEPTGNKNSSREYKSKAMNEVKDDIEISMGESIKSNKRKSDRVGKSTVIPEKSVINKMPERVVSRIRRDNGKYTQRNTPVHEMDEERVDEMEAIKNSAVERTIATESIKNGKLQGRARNPKYQEKKRKMASQDGESSHNNDRRSHNSNFSNKDNPDEGAIMKKHIVQNVEKGKMIQDNNVKIARKAIKMDPKIEDINQVQNLISSKDGEQVHKMANTKKKVTIKMSEHKSKMAERKKNLKKFYENEMADVQGTWRPNENVEITNMQ